MPEPFQATVRPDWVDYNRHLDEGYYAVIFAGATEHLLTTSLGFGHDYRTSQRATFYTVETHLRFLREVADGATVRVESQVVGVRPDRLHLWHVMWPTDGSWQLATQEALILHVDLPTGRVRPMPERVRTAAEALTTRPEGVELVLA